VTVPSVVAEAPPAPDPLAGYSLTGLVETDGEMYALLEDNKTKVGTWFRVGDEVSGLKISSINASGMTLSGEQGDRRIALNEKFDLTPLDKDANYMGGRVTNHEDMETDTGTKKLAVTLLARLDGLVYGNTTGGTDFRKLNDDAFEGKVPLNEYHERVNAAKPTPLYLNDIDVSYGVLSNATYKEAIIVR